MRTFIAVALLAFSLDAAAINKCVIDGKTVYTDAPCPTAAKATAIAPPASGFDRPESSVAAPGGMAAREKKVLGAMVTSRRLAEIDGEIERSQGLISAYRNSMDTRLSLLRVRKLSANNNLAGATYEQSLSTEMDATVRAYTTKINIEQSKIDGLRAERASLAQ